MPDMTPDAVASATSNAAGSEAANTPDGSGTVTAVMRKLDLTGEAYAALGDPRAPLTVVEFSDYGCPFCRRYTTLTYQKLKRDYIDTGRVFYVFKDFPIVQLHPQAKLAAEAAECVGRQGAYWQMHEVLFANQSTWDTTAAVARAAFAQYAGDLKIDRHAFETCMDQGQTRANVEKNMAEGQHLGIDGTPSFVINGKLLSGAQPTETFQRVFDRELEALGAVPLGTNP
jgi:protein-disulfide isomerase